MTTAIVASYIYFTGIPKILQTTSSCAGINTALNMEISTFEKNERIAEGFHDKGLDFSYVHSEQDKAITEIRKAVILREALFGKYHNDTALSYFRLGSILIEETKDYVEALVVSRREFRISQNLHGGEGTYTIDNNEGWLVERKEWMTTAFLKATNKSKENAENYWSQLLQSITLESLGDSHFKAREWELAVTQYNCSLAIETAAYGRNRLDMADLQVKIGDCLRKIEDFPAALEEYKNAEAIYKDEFGNSQHTAVAILDSKVAAIHLKLNDFDSALASHSKAYASYERYFGKEHEICREELQSIRLVAVKEIEYIRNEERMKIREEKKTME